MSVVLLMLCSFPRQGGFLGAVDKYAHPWLQIRKERSYYVPLGSARHFRWKRLLTLYV